MEATVQANWPNLTPQQKDAFIEAEVEAEMNDPSNFRKGSKPYREAVEKRLLQLDLPRGTPYSIQRLIADGTYALTIPLPSTHQEEMGWRCVRKTIRKLRRLNYAAFYIVQDRNNRERKHPDLLAWRPLDGWIQVECHFYLRTSSVDNSLNYRKNVAKGWLKDVPRIVVMFYHVHYSQESLDRLQYEGIALFNGLHSLTELGRVGASLDIRENNGTFDCVGVSSTVQGRFLKLRFPVSSGSCIVASNQLTHIEGPAPAGSARRRYAEELWSRIQADAIRSIMEKWNHGHGAVSSAP